MKIVKCKSQSQPFFKSKKNVSFTNKLSFSKERLIKGTYIFQRLAERYVLDWIKDFFLFSEICFGKKGY